MVLILCGCDLYDIPVCRLELFVTLDEISVFIASYRQQNVPFGTASCNLQIVSALLFVQSVLDISRIVNPAIANTAMRRSCLLLEKEEESVANRPDHIGASVSNLVHSDLGWLVEDEQGCFAFKASVAAKHTFDKAV